MFSSPSCFARLALTVLVLAVGCDAPMEMCDGENPCPSGSRCVDGMCVDEVDSGDGEDAGGGDAGRDASATDAGPFDGGMGCSRDDQCTNAVCAGGVCCDPMQACGDACCGSEQQCFANACVSPGAACSQLADCADGEYCEIALGETPEPMEGCLASAPVGRCLTLPATPAECTVVPDIDATLEARMQWAWETEIRTDEVDVWSSPVVGRVFDTNCDGAVDILDPPNVVFVSGRAGNSGCQGSERGCVDGIIRVLDGLTGTELASIERAEADSVGFQGFSVALGDVDGDGVAEIVAETGEGKIAVLEGDGTVVAISADVVAPYDTAPVCPGADGDRFCNTTCTTPAESNGRCMRSDGTFRSPSARCAANRCLRYAQGWGGGLALGDMDNDGAVDVAAGPSVMEIAADGSSVDLRFTATEALGGTIIRQLSFFADINGDGGQELIAANVVYDADGNIVHNIPAPAGGYAAIANFDQGAPTDTGPEIVYVASGRLFIRDARTGVDLLPEDPNYPSNAALPRSRSYDIPSEGSGGPPTVANFDGAPGLEVGVAMRDAYSVTSVTVSGLTATVTPVWATPNHDRSSSVTGSTVFDFEGDGQAEVVYNDECYLWVYDGATGAVRFAHPTASFTATEAALVADIDGDGHAEMLMVGNGIVSQRCVDWHEEDPPPPVGTPPWVDSDGDGTADGTWSGVFAFEDVAGRWVGTRPLWNQHSYSVTNVCSTADDACVPARPHGAIPTTMQNNWELPWLNNFRQNVQADGLFDAADASLLLRYDCRETAWVATVQNLGQAILPAGVVVRLYRQAAGGEVEVASSTTTEPLFGGQGTELLFELDEPPGTEGFRVEIDNEPATFVQCRDDNDEASAPAPSCLL